MASNKVYIVTTVFGSYDRIVCGHLVPEVFNDYKNAVESVRKALEDDVFEASYIDAVNDTLNTYDPDTQTWEAEPITIDDDELYDNWQETSIIFETTID